jgi:hypothetical protein
MTYEDFLIFVRISWKSGVACIAHEYERHPDAQTGRRTITAVEVTDTIVWLEMTAAAVLVVLDEG